ncbi:MAG TPA: hypothetical protein VIW68_14095 [Candidatus Sulfotelmatobacter sp.]
MKWRQGSAICALLVSLSSVIAAQDGTAITPRTVQLSPSLPNDPVKIVKVMLDGTEVKPGMQAWPADKPGVPFQGGDDWYNHLTVVLKNISPKKIVCGGVNVIFLGLGDGTPNHPMVGEQTSVGQRPEHGQYSGITGRKLEEPPRDAILVEPGQEFRVQAVSPDRLEGVKETIESRQPVPSIASIRVGLSTVYFEDGTKWAANLYYRPDFRAKGKYVVISRKEFDNYGQEASQ